ncbi:MAG: choice-of-anchor R domain-containing protein [Armatimonas sp.]
MLGTLASAHADTIFDNFGAGNTYQAGSWEFRGENNISRIDRAKSFVPSQSYSLTSIETALYWETGDKNFDISIYSDAGGAPGTALSTFTQLATAPLGQTILYTSAYSGITLNAGSTYWVVINAASPNSSDGGFWLASSPTDTGFSTFSGGSWNTSTSGSPVIRVSGTLTAAAPEPASLVLLCLATPLLFRKRHS